MKYMGSKARHAGGIVPFLMRDHNPKDWYCEPFVGGANMIDKIPAPKKIGFDIHPFLIATLKAASNGWMPPNNFTEEDYGKIKNYPEKYPPELVGYVGFALSYGGKYFGGWCRDRQGKRDYVQEAYRNAIDQFPKLQGTIFKQKSVFDINFPARCTIYCDPPYAGTTKYSNEFDHIRFYSWCRQKRDEGHRIFISEYSMPEDFVCVWEKRVTSSLTANTGNKLSTERLYTLCTNNS